MIKNVNVFWFWNIGKNNQLGANAHKQFRFNCLTDLYSWVAVRVWVVKGEILSRFFDAVQKKTVLNADLKLFYDAYWF